MHVVTCRRSCTCGYVLPKWGLHAVSSPATMRCVAW